MLPYKAFIDGLRAVSIIAVVGFHVGIPGFSGGFVGVDIFFVISGYLIIGQITEAAGDERFSFLRFYASRTRRILPPLLIVLVASVLLAPLFLVTPDEMSRFGKSVTASALMVANHQFLHEQGYFDIRSELKPLLSLWTLSVEEQFYAVAPLLIVSVAWIARRKHADFRSFWFRAAAGMSVLSLACCILLTRENRNLAFFLMPFRGWEFLMGGAIGLAEWKFLKRGDRTADVVAALGMAAILAAIALFSRGLLYPSAWALLPVAGAVAIIVAGSAAPDSPLVRLLATPPLVGIGVVSYGWYLWHWPLLAFLRLDRFGDPSISAAATVALIAFCLAVAMYLSVERPLRRWSSKNVDGRTMGGVVAAGAVALVLVAGLGLLTSGLLPGRLAAAVAPGLLPPAITDHTGEGDACVLRQVLHKDCVTAREPVSFGLLFGDSFAEAIYPVLTGRAAANGARMVSYWQGGCPPIIPARPDQADWKCSRNNARALNNIGNAVGGRLSFAVISANWKPELELWAAGYYAGRSSAAQPTELTEQHFAEFAQVFSYTIERLIGMSASRILLLGEIPGARKEAPDCLVRADRKKLDRDEVCSWSRSEVQRNGGATDRMLKQVASRFGGSIRYIDPAAAFCDELRCRSYVGDSALYVDAGHLSPAGVEQLYAAYAADFEWAFSK
jgi:peptidoglycan/LPS O-acetylase OafA/YrhL